MPFYSMQSTLDDLYHTRFIFNNEYLKLHRFSNVNYMDTKLDLIQKVGLLYKSAALRALLSVLRSAHVQD